MSSNPRKHELEYTGAEATSVRQRSVRDSKRITNKWEKKTSFDRIALVFVVSALFASLGLLLAFGVQAALPSTIALVTSVFTLFSVRESKRDREANVAPTLFVGKRREEYGILNLGNGPAHDLSVKVRETRPADWDGIEPQCNGEILRTDNNFLSLETESQPDYVHLEYRSNVRYRKYNVTRRVLTADEN